MSHECCEKGYIEFINPWDGDVLNQFDGRIVSGKNRESLEVRIQVVAPNNSQIKINGVPAVAVKTEHSCNCSSCHSQDEELYEATVLLDGYRNIIVAQNEDSSVINEIVVYWLKEGTNKYRISTDDNIWFLKDLTQNSNIYKSIFDNPYIKVFKDVHDKYGTKVHFNLFYQTEDFNLSQMTDKFKSEWQANSDWIKFTFHSLQEFPDNPYNDATFEQMKNDYLLVTNEIIRFAGKELLSPITTTHWGSATIQAARALRTLGIKGLVGYFKYDAEGNPVASYYADNELIDHVSMRDAWKDNLEDIMYIRHDIVLDSVKLENIDNYLDNIKRDPHQSGLIEMLIHEQYFYEHYKNYQPEYRDKVMKAAKWAKDNGYQPALWTDVVLEK